MFWFILSLNPYGPIQVRHLLFEFWGKSLVTRYTAALRHFKSFKSFWKRIFSYKFNLFTILSLFYSNSFTFPENLITCPIWSGFQDLLIPPFATLIKMWRFLCQTFRNHSNICFYFLRLFQTTVTHAVTDSPLTLTWIWVAYNEQLLCFVV